MSARWKHDCVGAARFQDAEIVPRGRLVSGFSRTRNETVSHFRPDTQFNAPRWSPDGRYHAIERHRLERSRKLSSSTCPHMWSALWLPILRLGSSHPHGDRTGAPSWLADYNGDTFNLYEFDIDNASAARQLTQTSGGALWPDVSKKGDLNRVRRIYRRWFDVSPVRIRRRSG